MYIYARFNIKIIFLNLSKLLWSIFHRKIMIIGKVNKINISEKLMHCKWWKIIFIFLFHRNLNYRITLKYIITSNKQIAIIICLDIKAKIKFSKIDQNWLKW
jgi:hypothetical protein